MSATIIPSVAEIKRAQRTARDALRAVRDGQRTLEADVFGSYSLDEYEDITEDMAAEVVDLLRLARQTYPDQEIELIVVAHIDGQGREGARHGQHQGPVLRDR